MHSVDESLIQKKCVYNGQFFVELSEKRFIFHPKMGIRQCSIFYDIAGHKLEEEDKLSIKIKRSNDKLTIQLLQMNDILLKTGVVDIVLNTPLLMMDTLKDGYDRFKKSLQMFGDYMLIGRGKIVDALFVHADGTEYEVLINDQTLIGDVYRWLCSIWPMRCECTEYYISTLGVMIEDSLTLSDLNCDRARFDVAEKCYAYSVCEESPVLIVPWNKKLPVLLRSVAVLLSLEDDEVRLMDGRRAVLRGQVKLDIGQFREDIGRKAPPVVWYDVRKTMITCISIRNKNDSLELPILNDYSAMEMKIKLAKSLAKDWRRVIISQKKKLLANDDIITTDAEVEYCIGETLDDIVFKEKIGQGGFGEVFKCAVKSTLDVRAMKKFLIPLSDDTKRISLIREIVFIFSVPKHDNLVHYYDIYVDDTDIYIGMEFLSGGSLKNCVEVNWPLSVDKVKKYCREILAGLGHLHKNHVNHRDIKGDNVLLTKSDVAKLCDFGISTILPDCRTKDGANQTKMFGTLRYMAPEVVSGEPYAFMADIWAFGATTIEMVTGKVPHQERKDEALIFHIRDKREIIYSLPTEVSYPNSLKDLINACLRPDAKDRPTANRLLEFQFFKD